jgi:hypothetical protein
MRVLLALEAKLERRQEALESLHVVADVDGGMTMTMAMTMMILPCLISIMAVN